MVNVGSDRRQGIFMSDTTLMSVHYNWKTIAILMAGGNSLHGILNCSAEHKYMLTKTEKHNSSCKLRQLSADSHSI